MVKVKVNYHKIRWDISEQNINLFSSDKYIDDNISTINAILRTSQAPGIQ